MYTDLWKEFHGAVGCLHLLNENNIRLATFSGFKVNNYFITDDNVLNYSRTEKIKLCFMDSNGLTETTSHEINMEEFRKCIIKEDKSEAKGFIIININGMEAMNGLPGLNISKNSDIKVGQEVVVLGHQCDKNILSINPGIITSNYADSKGNKYFQLNSSIKKGMSGAPVIDILTGKVIAMIKNNCDEKNKTYYKMNEISKNNIRILNEAKGNLFVKDIDPFQALIANQYQIKLLSKTLFNAVRSNEGYALDIVDSFHHFFEINPIATKAPVKHNIKIN